MSYIVLKGIIIVKLLSTIILLSLLTVSCSKKAGKTDADFKFILGGIASLSNTGGGAMLWGKSDAGASFSVNLNNLAGDLALDLKNGTWSFYAISWEGSGGYDISGKQRCALSKGNVLSGGEVSVDLSLSNSTCTQTDFAHKTHVPTTYNHFPYVQLSSCKNLSGVTGNIPCQVANSDKGHALSFQLVIPEHIQGNVGGIIPLTGGDLVSKCFDFDVTSPAESLLTVGSSVDHANIPFGNGQAPFRTIVRAFFDANCGGSRGHVDDVYELGLFAPNISGANGQMIRNLRVKDKDPQTVIAHHEIPPNVACNLSAPGAGDFSTGNGTTDSPFGICHPHQFNSVGNGSGIGQLTASNNNYELLSDLDFGGFSKGINDPLGAPECAKIGTSLMPFGGLKSDFPTCSTPITTPTAFDGVFNGNNYTIRNAFIMEEDLQYVGIFRKVAGTGEVKNLNLDNIEVEGHWNVGIISGQVSGASATIKNITIKDGSVEARESSNNSYAGGVVGEFQATNPLDNIHLRRVQVEGRGYYLGGIVGHTQANISNSSFYGRIYADSEGNSSPISKVGGLAGFLQGSQISNSKSNGGINGQLTIVGGLAGYLDGTSSITDSYSNMFISSSYTTGIIAMGGLVGESARPTTASVDKSYFSGGISENCTAASAGCKIGDIIGENSGAGTPTPTNSFSVNTTAARGGQNGTTTNYTTTGFQNASFTSTVSSWGASWQGHNPPDVPRLAWESTATDPCLDASNLSSIGNQVSSYSRGTEDNPIIICHPDQFLDIENYPAQNYKLQNVINLHEFVFSDKITTFSGSINGDGMLIHSAGTTSTSDNTAIIDTISSGAKLENIIFAGIDMVSSDGTHDEFGSVAVTNQGLIQNVHVFSSKIAGDMNVGGIVAHNIGVMKGVAFHYGIELKGSSNVGGIAGTNTGTIQKVMSFGFSAPTVGVTNLGGIVGDNSGTIEEAISGFNIQIGTASSNVGGIAGNNSGTIRDVMFDNHGMIDLTVSSSNVGGIVGLNPAAPAIERALFVGDFRNIGGGSTNGPIIGNNTGGTPPVRSYFSSQPYTTTGLSSLKNVSSTSVPGPGDCDLTLDGTLTGRTHITLGGKAGEMYSIAPQGGVIYRISMDATNCGNIGTPSITEMDLGGGNTIGTYTHSHILKTLDHYCDDVLTGDPNFRCTSGWDMIEDNVPGNGFNHLIDVFRAELFDLPPPASRPIWTIQDGQYYPRPLFDW